MSEEEEGLTNQMTESVATGSEMMETRGNEVAGNDNETPAKKGEILMEHIHFG